LWFQQILFAQLWQHGCNSKERGTADGEELAWERLKKLLPPGNIPSEANRLRKNWKCKYSFALLFVHSGLVYDRSMRGDDQKQARNLSC